MARKNDEQDRAISGDVANDATDDTADDVIDDSVHDSGPDSGSSHLTGWIEDLGIAMAFFTRLPLMGPVDHGPPDFSRAARAAPLAGLAVGVIGGVAFGGLIWTGLSPLAAAFVAAALTIFVTGGLHEDGLADTADGLGAFNRERRLAIMRDSRIGSYGVLALIIGLGLKVALLSQIAGQSGALAGAAALIAAEAASRLTAIYPLHVLSPARPDGLAQSAATPRRSAMMQGAILAGLIILICVLPMAGVFGFIAAMVAAALVALAGTRWADHMLGGHTGDVAGAIQQVTVLGILTALAIMSA